MRGMAIDIRIHEVAAGQHGVVSRAQLIGAGIPPASVDRRVRAGLLERLHRGVYGIGCTTQKGRREMAAVLACECRVIVSHLSSAGLDGLAQPPASGPVHVIARGTEHGRKRNMHVHRYARLRDEEITSWEGIPITTPARTLLDLAGMVRPSIGPAGRGVRRQDRSERTEAVAVTIHDVDRAVNEVFARRLTTRAALLRLLDVHRRVRGARVLREILVARTGATKSEAEKRLLALLRRAELPEPEVNAVIDGIEVDFLCASAAWWSKWMASRSMPRPSASSTIAAGAAVSWPEVFA